jgi:heat shock protein HslJ
MRLAIAAACLALLPWSAFAQSTGAGGWALTSVGGIAAVPGGRIAFASDGAVFGTTGCNRFQGQAVAAPGVLTFVAPFAVTKMACLDEAKAAQETRVLEALQGTVAVAYDPVADRMMLIPQEGAATLGFSRAD